MVDAVGVEVQVPRLPLLSAATFVPEAQFGMGMGFTGTGLGTAVVGSGV